MSVTPQEIYGRDIWQEKIPKFDLNICHLYGNLLNTYGDNGNILMLKYIAEKLDVRVHFEIVSLEDTFDEEKYDLVFFGGGQDFEQSIVSKDIQMKKIPLTNYIEKGGVLLSICGGYQFLGQYYQNADGEKIPGIGALPHYTLNQEDNRFIGDIEIVNEETNEHYYGFENHQGRTFLGEGERPLGRVLYGCGNNGEDKSEGVIYKNVYGSYFHGPLLSRNAKLGYRLIKKALENRYGMDILIADWDEILGDEEKESHSVNDPKAKAEKQ